MHIFAKASLLLVIAAVFTIGCQSSIQDNETEQKPPLMNKQDVTSDRMIFEFRSDEMQRDGKFPINLVVDQHFYEQNDIKRGDIVYLELPDVVIRNNHEKYGKVSPDAASENRQVEQERKRVSRVIGMPNEIVRITKGQVYVNRQRLDTFYGREYFWGKLQDKKKAETMKEDVQLQENHYFIMADQWWRSPYTSNWIGAVPKEYIKGKVVGYVEEEKPQPPAQKLPAYPRLW